MEQAESKPTRANARERWAAHLANWQASGLTQTEYCRRENIDPNSFSNWKRKLCETSKPEADPGFVELGPAKVSMNGVKPAPPILEFSIGPEGVTFRLNLNAAWNWRPGA
jgi:hypothetical protein